MEKEKNKKPNTRRIFTKIFWPVVYIVIAFAVATFSINYFYIDRFVKESATEKLEEAYSDVVSQISDYAESGEGDFEYKASKQLISQSNNTQVFIFDEEFNDLLEFDSSVYVDQDMIEFVSSLLSNYELEEDTLTNIIFGGKEYIANTYIVSNSLNINEKYFVVIQELTGKSNLLRESSRRLLLIQLVALILIIFTIYLVAKELSRPLIKLSNESEEYVAGKNTTIDKEQIPITELESLRQSLASMQKRINDDIDRRNTTYENVAHDLRTPLVSILGYADGLRSGIIKDKRKACDVILRSGNQLKEMIENILVLNRFDNDAYKESREVIRLADLIEEQVETVKVIDDKIKITFDNKIQNETILSDRKLLVRIIQNLLSNAIKYASSKVIISASNSKDKNYKYVIKITDDGHGIDKKNLENIFKRYYKGNDGRFGIGLAVVKSSVDYIGATIDVVSKKNKGTTFRIRV